MALRDQPYIPLYIQDIMTDEKLNECSAATHGIYIKGIMCLMHKSETYGKILLKQKYKQNKSKCLDFACQLVKHLPYKIEEIEKAIEDLINENVCYFEDDFLCQKRMIKDNDLSLKRSRAGKKGGKSTQLNTNFAKAKPQANSENEIAIENENENTIIDKGENEKKIPENKNYPIDELVEELRQMCGGSLDGTIDSNSINCLDCLEKIDADFPEVDTVKSLRILMEGGRADKFHARNLTNFGYLFRNMIKIKESININVHGKQDPEMEQLKRDTAAKLAGTYIEPTYDPE